MTQTIDLSDILLERATAIIRLKDCGLDLKWLKEYTIPCLLNSCARKEKFLPGVAIGSPNVEQELIQNPNFAAWYAGLLPLFPEDVLPEPEPISSGYRGRPGYHLPQPTRKVPTSRRATLMLALYELLETCNSNGRDITAYPQDKLLNMLEQDHSSGYERLVFLENFASAELSEDMKQRVLSNLHRCVTLPLELDEPQKALLVEPYVTTRCLFMSAPFEEIMEVLDDCPTLLDIIRLLHEKFVYEELVLGDYKIFAQDAQEYFRLLENLIAQCGHDAASNFIIFWKRGGCPLRELRTIKSQAEKNPEVDWTEQLSTYAGYVNQLYGSRFKNIDLGNVDTYQEDILVYAIVQNKKHFIKLVDANTEQFLKLPSVSILFQEKLYREHFNLNELTELDLKDCAWMVEQKLSVSVLAPDRRYTFPELKALYSVPMPYIRFYHALQSENQDYRLKVFQQIVKRRVLTMGMDAEKMSALAAHLDSKPLDAWMQTDFGHISGLTASNAVQMLVHLDKLRHMLPGIQNQTDVLLALRNLDAVEQYESIADLKEHLVEMDSDWRRLAEEMNLSPEFLERHRENIIRFLCKNGAYIAMSYLKDLADTRKEAYLRVVKAELMGQFRELKYYEGDLQRELDAPLTNRIRTGWSRNICLDKDGLEVREHDDFFATMLLGTQPQRTCLNYVDGAYKKCLLSAFDSNKKILYVTMGGTVVGRAFLRLTKGRLGAGAGSESGFTFVDLENVNESHLRTKEQERITLFLERPYIAGVGPEIACEVTSLFVRLAEQKADELGTMLILSTEYQKRNVSGFTRTQYAVYISKSKAGSQYLDSLGGQATVNTEGSYSTGTFLVQEPQAYALAV